MEKEPAEQVRWKQGVLAYPPHPPSNADAAEKEMDSIVDNEDEGSPVGDPAVPGGSTPTAELGRCEARGTDEEERQRPREEVSTEGLPSNPQDAPPLDPASGSGETESCWGGPGEEEDAEEEEVSAIRYFRIVSDVRTSSERCRKMQETMVDDEEEEEDGRGGESQNATAEADGGRNSTGGGAPSGKRCRSRNSGSEQSNSSYTSPSPPPPPPPSSSSSSVQKGSLSSGSAPSGSRHKQTRRRNYHHQQGRGRRRTGGQFVGALREMLSDSLSTWCMSCVHMVIELIVTLTHNCGVGVEAGGVAVYGLALRLLARVTDVPGMKRDARRVLEWTRVRGAGVLGVVLTTLWWAKRAFMACCGMFFVIAILGYLGARRLFVRLGGERGQRWWAAFRDARFWGAAGSRLARVINWFRRAPPRPSNGGSGPESPGRTAAPGGRYQPDQELERLLAMAQVPEEDLDPFAVLGVEVHATETELKRAYRQLAVQVHPDKNKHPRAGEAFKVLRAAWDIVSNPETRREYELKRMAATELSKSMNEFLTKLQDDLKEAMNTMMCTKCEGKHKRFEMPREPAEARFCAECNRCHSAEEGDLWAESSMLGLRITYFAFMDGKVYDITEWAGCQRIGISPDTHRVPYHISFGSKNNSSSTRQRTTSENGPSPSNPADLQDFFNRIFQGGPVNDMAANGGFFPSGGPSQHHPPGGAGGGPGGVPPPFSPPQAQTGFFMPGGGQQQQRPEPGGETPSSSWTESGKPPRRKKKVRKPFQR